MDNKDKKVLKQLIKNNSINIKTFLISCCGIRDSRLLNQRYHHKDIKCLFPDLKRFSYKYVLSHVDDVYLGNVVLVRDFNNNIIPYLNPKIQNLEDIDDYDCDFELENEDDNNSMLEEIISLEDLELYQLIELCKKYKELNRITEYRRVCRIIKKKKSENEVIYQKRKKIINMKGREEYDQY